MLTKHHLKKHKALYITLGILALIVILVLVMALGRFYPIAMVGNNFIWNKDYEQHIVVAKRFDSTPDKSEILTQMIDNAKKYQLTGKLDTDAELKYYKTGNSEEYNQFLNKYFSGNEKQF